jgi:hypothetical protein
MVAVDLAARRFRQRSTSDSRRTEPSGAEPEPAVEQPPDGHDPDGVFTDHWRELLTGMGGLTPGLRTQPPSRSCVTVALVK